MTDKLEFIISAQDKFSGVFGKLNSILPSVKTLALGSAAGVSAFSVALVANAKDVAETYDKVQKLSDQLGVSTEFLSKMEVAANFSGIAVSTMENSINLLQVGLGQAAEGTGVAKDALDKLGISAFDASGNLRNAEEIMPLLAKSLYEVKNASERSAIAADLFGRRGTDMLQAFSGGPENFRKMTDEAERFGVVINSSAGANAAAFNDSLYRVKLSFRGVRNEIAEQTMPYITALSNRFADFVADNRANIFQFASDFASSMGSIAEAGAHTVASLIDGWRGFATAYQNIRALLAKDEATWLKFQIAVRERALNGRQAGLDPDTDLLIKKNQEALNKLYEQLRDVSDAAADAYTEIANIAEEGLATDKIHEWVTSIKDALKSVAEEGTVSVNQVTKAFKEQSDQINDSTVDKVKETTEDEIAIKQDAYERLLNMRDQYLLSDNELLVKWFESEQEAWAGNTDALLAIYEIYMEKKRQLDEFDTQNKRREWQQQLDDASRYLGMLGDVAYSAGKDAFEIYKAIKIVQTTIAGVSAASKAYDEGADISIYVGIAYAAATAAWYALQITQIANQQYPSVHGGIDYVPEETTYLLDRGERVLSPKQNRDLTDALSAGNVGGKGDIGTINVALTVNATTRDDLLNMTRADWAHVATDKMVPALREAVRAGMVI